MKSLGLAMNFHTDYAIGEWNWPGEKFLITCTTYINDDYSGGEIEFFINNKLIKYKPIAGDILVFPSGDPKFPGDHPYFHAVHPCSQNEKFLVKSFVKYTTDEYLDEWNKNIQKYGEKKWKQIAQSQAQGINSLRGPYADGDGNETYKYHELIYKLYKL